MPKPKIKKAAGQFGLAGIIVPLVMLALLDLRPWSDVRIGGNSVGVWAIEFLVMVAPPAPLVLTPSSQPWDWVVPYAIFFLLNTLLYAGIGALAAILMPRIAWYLGLAVCVLLLMLFLSDGWFLARWTFGGLGNNAPDTLFGVLNEFRPRYFLVAASIIVPALLGWRAAQRRVVKKA
jgi:hypothetical protein